MTAAPCPVVPDATDSAATRANIFAPPATSLPVAWPLEFAAWLDQTDRIVHLSSSWDDFVEPAHRRREVLARPVEWFIADATLRECFRALFGRIRHEHRTAKMRARCDLAAGPRAMQLSLVPLSAGAIEITWSFLHGAAAQRVAPAPRHRFSAGALLRMCSWCHDVNLGSTWQRLEDVAPALGLFDHDNLPSITHGICPTCSGAVAAETAAHRALSVAV